jgi:hypothetical protein
MALTIWTEQSGYSFGTFQERAIIDQLLPVDNDDGVIYSVISGTLPPGTRLVGNTIKGTPYEVPRLTTFNFCIRASKGVDISDRTFNIIIDGSDEPIFTTAEGNLDIGLYKQYFVLDSTYIEYQIEAYDTDTATGQHLSYFIAHGDGELPPGTMLTEDGRIIGYVEPVLSIKPEDGNGWYDTGFYDVVAYDFGYRSTNGYDSYIYDTVDFDYSLPSFRPKKLNRNYEFTVTITDGDSVSKRTFSIFVVGDDYFRADNNVLLDSTGLFTADVTYLRAPIWVTSSDLGTFRANNYLVIFLDTYEVDELVDFNIISATDAWLQSHEYNVNDLIKVSDTSSFICITAHTSTTSIDITKWAPYGLPPNMIFDYGSADIYGRIPYQPEITETYRFTVSATRYSDYADESAVSYRTFKVQIIGEIDSILTWNTAEYLGSLNANYISTLKVQATSSVINAVLQYSIIDGELPNGLSLTLDGEIVGMVTQFSDIEKNIIGLTTFDYNNGNYTLFDGGTTSFDRTFIFTIQARDRSGYGAIERTFTIYVTTPNQVSYSNIKVQPLLKLNQRDLWKDFINDNSIFTPSSIYRLNDKNFGIQTKLSMIIYAGIQLTTADAYIGAMGLNHKRKRFQFGEIKKAIAINTGTNNQVYEVIYIQMVDPLEPNNKRLPLSVHRGLQTPIVTVDNSVSYWSRSINDLTENAPFANRPNPTVTIDSTGYQVSNPNPNNYFPNSISNWRDRLKEVGMTERNYLPLWMRSIQPGTKSELGFTLAVPLCYCKLGTADDIMLNIKYSGFDLQQIDYTTDRYIIDSVEGNASDQYLVFRNDRITI